MKCPKWINEVNIVGRTDGICGETGCKNKAYALNRLSPVSAMWECRRHYKEHQ